MWIFVASADSGIHAAAWEVTAGELSAPSVVAQGNGFFLTSHPKLNVIYSVDTTTATVSAYRVAADGTLQLLNQVPSDGAVPCHLASDSNGKYLVVANYNGGVTSFALDSEGKLSTAKHGITFAGGGPHKRQDKPHPHGVTFSPDEKRVYISDLGTDRIQALAVDPDSLQLRPLDDYTVEVAGGAGPRHFVFAPDGRSAVAVNELSNTLTVFAYDPDSGKLQLHADYPMLEPDFKGISWAAEVAYHPTGRACYATNRGEHTVVVYSIDQESGVWSDPQWLKDGENPQHLLVDPTGRWLLVAWRTSNEVAVYPLNPETGQVIGPRQATLPVAKPMCILLWDSTL